MSSLTVGLRPGTPASYEKALPRSLRSWPGRPTAIVAVATFYIATGKLGFLAATASGNVTTVWPPSGIALAALLLLGSRIWPGIWLGSFLVNVWFFSGITNVFSVGPLAISACIAAGSTLQALLGAFLIGRFLGTRSPLSHPQDTFKFIGIAQLSCLIAATVGATSLCFGGLSQWAAFPFTWWTWCLGDTAGVVLVAPLILIWSKRGTHKWRPLRFAEFVLAPVLLVTVCLMTFGIQPSAGILYYPRLYGIFPLLTWVAFRLGQRGVSLLVLVTSGMALWATYHGLGPFVEATRSQSLISLYVFLEMLAVSGLVLAAAAEDRQEVAERFRLVFDSAPNAMLMVGHRGRIVLGNSTSSEPIWLQAAGTDRAA